MQFFLSWIQDKKFCVLRNVINMTRIFQQSNPLHYQHYYLYQRYAYYNRLINSVDLFVIISRHYILYHVLRLQTDAIHCV